MNPQEVYETCIREGGSPRLAAMLANRRAPAAHTDTSRFTRLGVADPLEGIPDEAKHTYVQKAKAAGVSIRGKQYFGTLAKEPGDPEAWVDSTGDARRLCERRGWGMTGNGVKLEPAGVVGPREKYEPAEDLVQERAVELLEQQGAEDTVSKKEYDKAYCDAYDSLMPRPVTFDESVALKQKARKIDIKTNRKSAGGKK